MSDSIFDVTSDEAWAEAADDAATASGGASGPGPGAAPAACAPVVPAERDVTAVLAEAERDLAAAAARVAALRRALPPGPAVDMWTPLTTATGRPTTLGALFGDLGTLVLLHVPHTGDTGGAGTGEETAGSAADPEACLVADGVDALAPHLAAHTAVAVVSPAPPGRLADLARERGWRHVRLASTQPGDLDARTAAIVVLVRTPRGVREHARVTGPALDAFCAVWPLLDALPDGRGAWRPTGRAASGPAAESRPAVGCATG